MLAAITAAAAALRLTLIGKVAPDPFYDAAVRSMGLSWHNFFFGAFEPGASVSIDKPPVDLWLQVLSVKLFGFSATTLKLPEALAGIAAVPLLFLAVRRMWSTTAGLAAAAALAVLPVDVITSRSDTMDGVMMMLIVLALLLILRACETGRLRWLLGGAAVLGLAFDVKILESLVALPALALIALLGFPATRGRRALALAGAGAVYVVVALAWLTATLFVPAGDRPWAIGSTNGSAWNAVFVFNGSDRLGGKSPEPQFTVYEPGHNYPVATQSQRDHIPIVPPSPTRLLARIGPLSGERLGMELLAALLLGIPALFWSVGRRRRAAAGARRSPTRTRTAAAERPLSLAVAAGLGLWLLTGIVLFSHMARLHPRYVEGFVPAVAATLGIGAAWASEARGRARPIVLVLSLAVVVVYGERLLYGTSSEWWIALAGALGALALAALARWRAVRPSLRALAARRACSCCALRGARDPRRHRHHRDRQSRQRRRLRRCPARRSPDRSAATCSPIRAARSYEIAAQSATQIGALIVRRRAARSWSSPATTRACSRPSPSCKHLIAAGEVRYAFLNSPCPHPASPTAAKNPACSAPAQWIRAHGTDVSRQAGLPHGKVLWLLPGAAMSERGVEGLTAGACRHARESGRLALDTEFVGEGRYRTLLCLIQVAVPARRRGPSASRCSIRSTRTSTAPARRRARRPGVEIVVHAGRQDVALLRRAWAREVTNVFDTQLAAGFAGLGAQARLRDAAARRCSACALRKSASFTRWDARPLTDEQLAYAREDVAAPARARRRARGAPRSAGRLDWAREECARSSARQRRARARDGVRAPAAGATRSTPAPRAIARALVQWREDVAERQDRPVRPSCSDAALIEIAKRRPRHERARADPRLTTRHLRRRGEELVDDVAAARELPPIPAEGSAPPPAHPATRR